MDLAVNGGGTAVRAHIAGHEVLGKTGTAQVISNAGKAASAGKTTRDLRDNSWFEFFAPRGDPEISGAVFVEHGSWGATAAAPIAKFVLETYFAKKEGRPLPVWPAPGAAPVAVAPTSTATAQSSPAAAAGAPATTEP